MTVRELDAVPRLLPLYAKAPLTGLGGGDALPDTELVVKGVAVDRDRLAAYDRVCGFRLGDRLPPTYPHVLGFPLQIELMAGRGFPFPLPGLVHVANRITQYGTLTASDRLDLHVWVEGLRPHAKGRQFDAVTQVRLSDAVVWEGRSTYLKRGSGSQTDTPDAADALDPAAAVNEETLRDAATWQVPSDIGRRYGAASGDRNPIHLHPWTAKLFGFPRNIAHGMWTKARALASFEGRLPEALDVAVRFRKPLVLPRTVRLRTATEGERWAFQVVSAKDGAPHLDGALTERDRASVSAT